MPDAVTDAARLGSARLGSARRRVLTQKIAGLSSLSRLRVYMSCHVRCRPFEQPTVPVPPPARRGRRGHRRRQPRPLSRQSAPDSTTKCHHPGVQAQATGTNRYICYPSATHVYTVVPMLALGRRLAHEVETTVTTGTRSECGGRPGGMCRRSPWPACSFSIPRSRARRWRCRRSASGPGGLPSCCGRGT